MTISTLKWKVKQTFRILKQRFDKKFKRQRLVSWVPKPYIISKYVDERQATCSHLKGGYRPSRYTRKDYAITDHTFIDGSRKVWCQLCKKTWVPGSWGWKRDVPEMLKHTTNGSTASQHLVVPAIFPPPAQGVNTTSYYSRMQEAKYKKDTKSTVHVTVSAHTKFPSANFLKLMRMFYLQMRRATQGDE